MTATRVLWTTLIALFTLMAPAFGQRAPFQGVRWTTQEGTTRTEILLGEHWSELVELETFPAEDILSFCEKTWPGKGRKRFGEDLVDAMKLMGHPVGDTVRLLVRDLESGKTREFTAAPMTAENRRLVWKRNNASLAPTTSRPLEPLEPLPDVIEQADERYAFLAELHDGHPGAGRVEVDDARRDLMQLEAALVERFSYLTLTGVDHRAAFEALHLGLTKKGEALTATTFAIGVGQLMSLFGDGHSRGSSLRSLATPGYAPYLLGQSENGVVAFQENRRSLLDEKYPYLAAIDGEDIEEWIESAKVFGARGSQAFERRQAIENLRYLAQMRSQRGAKADEEVELTLTDGKGRKRKVKLELRVDSAPVYGSWPRTDDGRVADDYGYLRIESMDSSEAFVKRLNSQMREFRDTEGLVIDVRGNGGGSRTALRTLLPYFTAPDEGPQVVNVAAYRLRGEEVADAPGGYLDNRYLYPAAWSGWSKREREAIASARENFEPDWELPEGFSYWHFMLVGPETNPEAFHYPGPVVVLMDTGCFSATDIFLGAFAERDRVTLVGTPSGGGSGRSRGLALDRTQLRLRLSSMASFRPSGARYDGKGIEVDVERLPEPTDFLGESDTVLEAAIDLLSSAH